MSEHTPLSGVSAKAGALFCNEAGWLMPAHYGDPDSEYRQACDHAALFDISHQGKVELTGRDACKFLHNLCTNDIKGLAIGAGCEAFLTTAQARVIARILIYHHGLNNGMNALWLDVGAAMAEKVIKHLDHYLIREQVEIADRTGEFAQMHLAGPEAKAVLETALFGDFPELAELHHVERTTSDGAIAHIRRHAPLALPGYDIVCLNHVAEGIWQALTNAGARPGGLQAYETLRVEGGAPVNGLDIDETNLAPEVGRTDRAISYTKGCYLGQEPVVRIRDLGHVNRSLLGLRLSGSKALPRGTKLFHHGKEAGYVTSSVMSPRLGTAIALAYIRRGSHEPGTMVEVEADGYRLAAEVASLPFIHAS